MFSATAMLVKSILSLLTAAIFWTQVSSKQYLKLLDFGDGPNTTFAKARFLWSNITNRHEESSLVYGVWRTTEDVDKVDQIDTILYRSRDVGGTVTWHYFNTFKMGKNSCDLLAARDMVWTPVVENTEPTFRCPWKKGDFNIKGGTWDMDKIAFLHLPSTNQWKVIMNIYSKKEFFASWYAVAVFENKKASHA